MYKLSGEETSGHCLECGAPLYGRTDKKFCNCSCKNKYHGSIRLGRRSMMNSTVSALSKNYLILENMLHLKTKSCPIETLMQMGFRPELVTHLPEKNEKHLDYRCFDIAYSIGSSRIFNLRRL